VEHWYWPTHRAAFFAPYLVLLLLISMPEQLLGVVQKLAYWVSGSVFPRLRQTRDTSHLYLGLETTRLTQDSFWFDQLLWFWATWCQLLPLNSISSAFLNFSFLNSWFYTCMHLPHFLNQWQMPLLELWPCYCEFSLYLYYIFLVILLLSILYSKYFHTESAFKSIWLT